jgi:hypothetical protein
LAGRRLIHAESSFAERLWMHCGAKIHRSSACNLAQGRKNSLQGNVFLDGYKQFPA